MKKINLKSLKSGFTLIELLVVVAIIGILASVVLSSLNTARAKGADAAIKANLANIRAQAAIIFEDNNQTYAGLCTDAVVSNQTTAAATALGGTVDNDLSTAGLATTVNCHVAADDLTWAVSSGTKVTPADAWCVDSTGASKAILGGFLAADATVCP
ncbi:hypothetical protein A3I90_01220 [Candidatus Nomurabacteria bacterium RIFCSPLOWO2_02_FULL_41_9]|nr:MAG: hypothetical protein A3I90_01220 [Candidatus Nomurabacteria bacterium RIFCSPLOWO2_02_FULL_41_9]